MFKKNKDEYLFCVECNEIVCCKRDCEYDYEVNVSFSTKIYKKFRNFKIPYLDEYTGEDNMILRFIMAASIFVFLFNLFYNVKFYIGLLMLYGEFT